MGLATEMGTDAEGLGGVGGGGKRKMGRMEWWELDKSIECRRSPSEDGQGTLRDFVFCET